jgi:hypothetical protein
MSSELESWDRPYFTPGGGTAELSYVVYGNISLNKPLDCQTYRSLGVPPRFELVAYDREKQNEGFHGFLDGYVWQEFERNEPALAAQVLLSAECIVVRGSIDDPPTLDYFRDTIGLLTYITDCGAIAVHDPFAFRWWSATQWRDAVFCPAGPSPRSHVVVLWSHDDLKNDTAWFHTRGMRKFGRPDISVHGVPLQRRDSIIDMIERFIELQALGGLVPEGQAVRMKSLPHGGVVRHGGSLDDPDFNNVHFEVVWEA